MGFNDEAKVQVDEQVFLSKFDGEALPENEVERLTILNGEVIEHSVISNGEVVGPVSDKENLTGKNIGRIFPTE